MARFAHANSRREDEREGGLTTDLYGNLLRVDLPDGRAIEYEVDGAGRRVGRRELDADGFEISFRGWIYRDLLRPIAEVGREGNVVARYVYADETRGHVDGLDFQLARLGAGETPVELVGIDGTADYIQRGTETLAIIADQVGTPLLVVNIQSGEVGTRRTSDEFGRVLATGGSDQSFPIGFTGGLAEQEFVRLGARDYAPEVGRWLVRDPIRLGDGPNGYLYSFNDVIGRWDINGLESFKECGDKCMDAFRECEKKHCPRPDPPKPAPGPPDVACEIGTEPDEQATACEKCNSERANCLYACNDKSRGGK